jgi:NADH-quinone oxidoreductase subunit N
MSPISIPMPDLNVVGPHVLILAVACLMILIEAFRPKKADPGFDLYVPVVGLGGTLLAIVYLALIWNAPVKETFEGMASLDRFATFFNLVILIGTALTFLVAISYMRKEQANHGEFYILTILAAFGMMIMVSTRELLMIFLGLETMSIAIYVMAGFVKRRIQCNESALKYFLLGAFASGFLLFGIALLYGASGSTHLSVIAASTKIAGNPMAMIGLGLILVGIGFKIASFPFHMWTPDVYDGAPVAVTGFMAVGVKAAAFAALIRIVLDVFGQMQHLAYGIIFAMAVLTMTYGNFAALTQRNIKRMLAYSSIAHTGYLLVGVAAIVMRKGVVGAEGILYYLLAYTFMNIGAFGVVAYLAKKDETAFDLEGYNGLGKRNPLLAAAMGVFMFSLAGIPPLAGFFGKFYVFSAAVKADLIALAIIGVLNSALSVYYYIRVVWYMYFRDPEEGALPVPSENSNAIALVIAAVFTFILGLLPAFWVSLAKDSIITVVRNF